MAGHQNRHPIALQLQQQKRQLVPRFGVKPAGRLVQQQKFGAMDDDLPNAHALLLPARQIAHAAIQLIRQPQKLHRAAHRLRQIAIGYAARFCRVG